MASKTKSEARADRKAKRTGKKRQRRVKAVPEAMTPTERYAFTDVMPFDVIHGGYLSVNSLDVSSPSGWRAWNWKKREVEVAQAAVKAGYCVAVRVPLILSACAASAVCQRLKGNLCAGYNEKTGLLLVWDFDGLEREGKDE